MSLEFAATVAERGFEVRLTVGAGETVAVLGPNGAGKSTLLNLIAGLLRPDTGEAVLGERTLFSLGAGGRRSWSPPHQRGVSMLAQEALLFPHLTAAENVAFGPRSKGVAGGAARTLAETWLDRVDAAALADRKPAQLSGGQAQRVAVARALASDPSLLLLDEPMAALDVSAAPALRRTLREVLADRAALIVTHDVLDAYTLADRVIVLQGGRVVDQGPTRAVLDSPTTPFTAGLAGLNLLTGIAVDAESVRTDSGHVVRVRPTEAFGSGARVGVAVRPVSVSVTGEDPGAPGEGMNALSVTVTDLEPRGDLVRVRGDELSADLPPAALAALDLAPGSRVWFVFARSETAAYPL
ncbi:ABC transporter ATP-binding protein [Herbiconiux moechotypicola]|uniref:ABC transporter ATP-binding protein n=1 Tax=Herbiconiux moechotypicola TaxID=637393 RepID=A0ABP5R1J5_9MICO|nr:ABC transporter ATP-binding protein [Herbiconiux moechotypicola]MCS5731369.1 ABC transporter ATP-binding protein [Herbiconiux moechotypicola]